MTTARLPMDATRHTIAISRAAVKFAAITLSFAAVYYFIAEANPTLAKSITEPFGFTIRLSSLTRAFALAFGPAVPIGTFLGSSAFNISVADLPIVPFVNMVIGLGIVSASKLWGRSTVKDLTLLIAYGLATGIVVALKLTGWALLIAPATWQPLLTGAIVLKVGVHTATYMAGYPLLRGFERLVRRG